MTAFGAIATNVVIATPLQEVITPLLTVAQNAAPPAVNDDTIPQLAETDILISAAAFTPKSASSTIVVDYVLNLHNTARVVIVHGIWKDAGTSAIAAGMSTAPGGIGLFQATLLHSEASASTAARTYKVGAAGTGGSLTINGVAAGRKLGGVMTSYIRVREFRV